LRFNPVHSGVRVLLLALGGPKPCRFASSHLHNLNQYVCRGWSTHRSSSNDSQVKFCPYDEEEPAIWFHLIEAQFAAAGIKSQKLKYANVLANLPKQVLQDILDTVNACNKSDQLFEDLKIALLGQFGKGKWHSYFELLRLPLDMKGLKPCILMGKLKQSLPHSVSPDNKLFLAMFLIRLSPSMQKAVGSRNHKTVPGTTRRPW
jgi:hypothetical protein